MRAANVAYWGELSLVGERRVVARGGKEFRSPIRTSWQENFQGGALVLGARCCGPSAAFNARKDGTMSAHDPVELVDVQLKAYNARDMDAFLETYATDAEVRDHATGTLAKGHSQMRTLYANVFADERLHATVAQRIVMGNTVIDHERRELTLQGKPGTDEAIAIYEVIDHRIGRLTLVRGPTQLSD